MEIKMKLIYHHRFLKTYLVILQKYITELQKLMLIRHV